MAAVGNTDSPLHGSNPKEVESADGWLLAAPDPERRKAMTAVRARAGKRSATKLASMRVMRKALCDTGLQRGVRQMQVEPDLGALCVPLIIGGYGVARVLNRKTTYGPLLGGIVWAIGMDLMEKTVTDGRVGGEVNADPAAYHVPANANVGAIDLMIVDEQHADLNELGAESMGEIGMTEVAASANTIHRDREVHA